MYKPPRPLPTRVYPHRAVLAAALTWGWIVAPTSAQAQSAQDAQVSPHAPGATQAAPPKDARTLHLRSLAATCATCHGTDGSPVSGSALPSLAGLPAGYIASQMRAFRDGSRSATVMHQIARGYSLAQIDALAAYFASPH